MLQDFSNESALDLLSKGAILLDIRTNEEFCSGHIAGAILVETPLPPLDEKMMATLKERLSLVLRREAPNKSTPIVVYCKKGIRARYAKKLIQELGYKNVVAWGGVIEPPLKQLFDTKLKVCYCKK